MKQTVRALTLSIIPKLFPKLGTLEEAAIYGLTGPDYNPKNDTGFPKEPTWCCRWTRKAVERKFGKRFAAFFKANARLTALAFQNSQYALRPNEADLPGDIWFWFNGHGANGHVGIRVGKEQIAQNTIRGYSDGDARVLINFHKMDVPDLRVRLR